ncbi:MAG: ribosomal protein S18-alanine N-acetyltransferase [Clostridia bacterium]|nr:ribosomal protein S18-alanine N-acetyltransferase [Clostridia bacterium]
MATGDMLMTAAQLAALESHCFKEPWSEQTILDSLRSGNYVFSYIRPDGSDIPAGYACGLIMPDQCEVQRVCVLPEFRRRGFGERLMNELRTAFEASGACSVFLEVRSQNTPARSLYKKLGYREIGIRKHYYADDDAVIYMLELR